jgi:hypothetical protein
MAKLSLCVLFLALFSACSLFQERDAKAPTSYSSRDFTRYQDIIDALIEIYSNPGRSGDLAMLFDDTLFAFEADSLDAADLPSVPRHWGRADEIRITSRLLADTASTVINFATTGSNAPLPVFASADSAVVRWNYLFAQNDKALTRYSGTSEFTLVRRQNRFYLAEWKDFRNSGSSGKSWGRWKMEKY